MAMSEWTDGLEGVVAARTVLSEVDGEAGRLLIRGYSLEDLAGRRSFEQVTAILWAGFFDDLPGDIAAALGQARREVFTEIVALDAPLAAHGAIEATRALTARLSDGDDLATALRLVAAPAVFTSAALRVRAGAAPIPPDPTIGHAADILRMIRGAPASSAEAQALDAYLVTVIDHGLTSAVVAGLSALKGPLHGGAPGPVIEMLDGVGSPENARAWLEAALDRGDRLMGFGHRVYRVRDPRADALKAVIRTLAEAAGASLGRLALAEAVEAAALAILAERKPGRSLATNVELYTALLLEALAFPPEAFTCVFAMGRAAGWIAHAREQVAGGRLIRPQSVYVGPRLAA
jgi:citrate synthase